MVKALALLALGAQAAVFGVLAVEARTLSRELSGLEQRIAASDLAEQEAARRQVCKAAVWPDIPMQCLERVSAAPSDRGIY